MVRIEFLELLLSSISGTIPVFKCSGLFVFNSCIRGFHAYKHNWDPVLGRWYSCITEKKNVHDDYTVVVVNEDEVVGHISLRMSKILSMTGSHMEVKVTGKYVNWRAGCGWMLPRKYHVNGQEKFVTWVSKKVNLVVKEHECVVNWCLDEKEK